MKKIGINDFTFYNYPTCLVMAPDGKHGAMAVVYANEKDNSYDYTAIAPCLTMQDAAA